MKIRNLETEEAVKVGETIFNVLVKATRKVEGNIDVFVEVEV